MSSQENRRHGIEKLKGRINYDEWKVAVKSYLTLRGYYIVIEEDIPADESPETNARAISEITLLIESSLYNYLENTKSAKKVWDNLAAAFEDTGVTRKVTILNQLVSVKLTQYKSIEKYINAILLYYNKSKTAGFQIQEDVIASLLLGGLPDEYLPMILGIENSAVELTIDYVKTVLLQGMPDPYENKEGDKAMATCPIKKKRRCFKCGSFTHLVIKCPKRNLKCSICGDIRHLARKCRRKKGKTNNETGTQKADQATSNQTEEKSLIAFLNVNNGNSDLRHSWFIDSGATTHICNNMEFFENIVEDYTGKEVLVANSESCWYR